MKRKLIAWVMALVLCLTLLPAAAFAEDDTSGTCGDNLTWALDGGTLTISGTGAMADWDIKAPWHSSCPDITAIMIGDGVTSIGQKAFTDCSSLTSIDIPNSVTSIGDYAFQYSSLPSITIPEGVTTIGECAFRYCSGLASVTIPKSVTTIDEFAFMDCSSLTSLTIPEGVTTINHDAFRGCTSLTSVTIPKSVTSISDNLFMECISLTSITIPESVTRIGNSAFYYCTGLTSITIPKSVTTIGYGIVSDCASLTDVYYGGSESDRAAMSINKGGNDYLLNAAWHYNSSGSDNTPVTTMPKSGFSDVPDTSPFSDAVAWAVEQGIAVGYSDGTFRPGNTCTAAQILTFLWRSQDSPDAEGEGDFAKAINWAKSQGVADADVNGDDYCTRADAVTYLWKLADSPSMENSVSFPDVPADADYATAVAWAVANNITTGFSDGTFGPDNTCTRGQIVTFLYRAYA